MKTHVVEIRSYRDVNGNTYFSACATDISDMKSVIIGRQYGYGMSDQEKNIANKIGVPLLNIFFVHVESTAGKMFRK